MPEALRILMIEDSPFDAELIRRELQRAKLDHSLERVETEEALVSSLQAGEPDVILADYNLPSFDGLAALRIARAKLPQTPFIFVSGSIGEERAVQTLREGATDYILKDRLSRLPVAITRAVTDRRERELREEAQQRLEQANRVNALGRMAATIAHEFNNVLMGIQPFAESLLRNSSDERISRSAGYIMSAVARGRRVTQQILRFTQPATAELQTRNLAEWIRDFEPELRSMLQSRSELSIALPVDPLFAAVDSALLQQAVANLVINAADAMPRGGTITISLDRDGDRVRLRVRDEGEGMTAEVQSRIFEPLYTTKASGTGIGLAVVKTIINSHGGTIEVSSTPGEGSVFTITLPAAAVESRDATAPAYATPVNIRRLLVVDDDIAVAAGLRQLLSEAGFEVLVVRKADQVGAAVEQFVPDVIILDIRLAGASGTDVFDEIRKHQPAVPIVFASGHADVTSLEAHTALPRVAFLRKPFDLSTLLQELGRFDA